MSCYGGPGKLLRLLLQAQPRPLPTARALPCVNTLFILHPTAIRSLMHKHLATDRHCTPAPSEGRGGGLSDSVAGTGPRASRSPAREMPPAREETGLPLPHFAKTGPRRPAPSVMRLTRVRLWPWSHPRRRGPGARTAGRGRRAPAGGGREGSRRPAGARARARAGLGARESARGPRSSVSPSRSAVAGSPARPRSSPRPLAAPGARRRPRVPAPPGRSHGAGRARPRSPGRPTRWPPYPRRPLPAPPPPHPPRRS